jgi:hypothetical protein
MFRRLAVLLLLMGSFGSQIGRASPDAVFVGAGPVGLYTAVQLKLNHPRAEILMFEKSRERKGTPLMYVEPHLFRDMSFEFEGPILELELEERLLEFALNLGIKIEYREVKSMEEISKEFPDVKAVVGSGGSGSASQDRLFPEETLDTQDFGYVADVNYKTLTKTRELSLWREAFPLLANVNHIVLEHVDQTSFDGKTSVLMRVFISKEEFDNLIQARVSFKDPVLWMDVDAEMLHSQDLYETISTWLKTRHRLAEEQVDRTTIKIAVARLAVNSPRVHVLKDGIHFFLVGDAAFGLPYFRNLKNGFESGNMLAKVLAKMIDDSLKPSALSKQRRVTPKDYRIFVNQLLTRENLDDHITSFDGCLSAPVVSTQLKPRRFMKGAPSIRKCTLQ